VSFANQRDPSACHRERDVLEDAIHADESAHILFSEHFDLVHLMPGVEAVEEMHRNRKARATRAQQR
jgi:hypothetical protein